MGEGGGAEEDRLKLRLQPLRSRQPAEYAMTSRAPHLDASDTIHLLLGPTVTSLDTNVSY